MNYIDLFAMSGWETIGDDTQYLIHETDCKEWVEMMKRFFLTLLKTHKDKVYHFFCSYTAMLTFVIVAIIKHGASIEWSINFGIAMAILVGVVKEFYDLYIKKSKFSIGDLVADVAGISIAFLIVGV